MIAYVNISSIGVLVYTGKIGETIRSKDKDHWGSVKFGVDSRIKGQERRFLDEDVNQGRGDGEGDKTVGGRKRRTVPFVHGLQDQRGL